MGYLVKSMRAGQVVSITVHAETDMAELERRMLADGIYISVVSREGKKTRISARAPSGTSIALAEVEALSGCLALGRATGEQIVISIRPDAVPQDALACFVRDGVMVGLGSGTAMQAVLRVKAPMGLLVLREELVEKQVR